MIKYIKKLSIFFFIFCIGFIVQFSQTNVLASTEDQETTLSEWAIRVGDLETTHLMGGVTLYKERLKTTYNGVHTNNFDTNSGSYEYRHNTAQWVDLPISNDAVKVVTWSEGTKSGWKASTVSGTAIDYEDTHPGWIVIAAVNGDGFQINDTKEPNNIHVQDGDVLQPILGSQPIGWADDDTPLIGNGTQSNVLRLELLDENGNVESYKEVTNVNTTPSETGITVLTKDVKQTFDLTGYTVYIGQYEKCRIARNGKIFVKGQIKEIRNDLTTDEAPKDLRDDKDVREFYIVCKDDSLKDYLNVSSNVRCQYSLTGEWSNVNSVISGFGDAPVNGTYAQILKDGQPLGAGSDNTFIKTTHPRTLVGFKEDGSTVLMVTDGRGKQGDYAEGTSYFQSGELMRLAGCVNAYNLDGGGSSTLVVRNEYGDFEVINRPSDGSERSIGNAILFVMKDPGIQFDAANTTRNEISFKQIDTVYANEVQDVVITIDGKQATYEDGRWTISGLEEDTTYTAVISYSIIDYNSTTKRITGSYELSVTTKAFVMPSLDLEITEIGKTGFTIIKKDTTYASWFSNIVISIDGEDYVLGNKNEIRIVGLIEDTQYELEISFTCTEPSTGNVYKGEMTKKAKTSLFEIPYIKEFYISAQNAKRATIAYEYSDPDGAVETAYITVGDKVYLLKAKSSTLRVTEFDLSKNEYPVQLFIQYKDNVRTIEVASEILTIGSKQTEIISKITYDLDGGTNSEYNPSEYVETTSVELATPTKEGYDFLGWYLNDELVTKIDENITGDITLVAKWQEKIITYTISYQLNGGTNNSLNPTTYTNKESVTLADPTKDGYTFMGWYYNNEKITTIENANITVEAKWEEIVVKKGCKKNSIEFVMLSLSWITVVSLILRKKH